MDFRFPSRRRKYGTTEKLMPSAVMEYLWQIYFKLFQQIPRKSVNLKCTMLLISAKVDGEFKQRLIAQCERNIIKLRRHSRSDYSRGPEGVISIIPVQSGGTVVTGAVHRTRSRGISTVSREVPSTCNFTSIPKVLRASGCHPEASSSSDIVTRRFNPVTEELAVQSSRTLSNSRPSSNVHHSTAAFRICGVSLRRGKRPSDGFNEIKPRSFLLLLTGPRLRRTRNKSHVEDDEVDEGPADKKCQTTLPRLELRWFPVSSSSSLAIS
ncbi:hypothetical protein EAG_16272 [Camponotus floridanus]|uniref:Uncharacterized protein n=1 Tax=Camponotus floridanus TaxID=104421 RepID=E2AG99_CAMFO|nr:hypothetical protein EAG_16272 [Camponotus floridanus]